MAGTMGTTSAVVCVQVRLEFDFQREARVMDTVAGHLKARAPARASPHHGAPVRGRQGRVRVWREHLGLAANVFHGACRDTCCFRRGVA